MFDVLLELAWEAFSEWDQILPNGVFSWALLPVARTALQLTTPRHPSAPIHLGLAT